MRAFLILLLASVSTWCMGQLFLPHRHAVISVSTQTFPLPRTNAIVLHWHALDLSSSPVSTWTDRIAGKQWTVTGASRPTWSTNGVFFNGTSTYLTNVADLSVYSPGSNGGGGTNGNSWLIISQWDTVTAPQLLFVTAFAGGQIFVGSTSTGTLYNQSEGPIACALSTNTFDLFFTRIGSWKGYTNGLEFYSHPTSSWSASAPGQFSQVAHTQGGQFFHGTLKEVIVWTNDVPWTPSELAAVHAYATNSWGGNP